MPRLPKHKQIYARVDAVTEAQINAYVKVVPDMNVSDLVRLAVQEYITNHPIAKEAK